MTTQNVYATDPIRERLRVAVHKIVAPGNQFFCEADLEEALVRELGGCERGIRIDFMPPAIAPRRPRTADIAACAAKGRDLPIEGIDPCARRSRLDVFAQIERVTVALELKFRREWTADTFGYLFLKDLHRLERLHQVDGRPALPVRRFALFVSRVSDYWRAASREPVPFSLAEGRQIKAGTWFQYDQPSAVTRWHGYPPFHLANEYRIEWEPIPGFGRFLLLEVRPQRSSANRPAERPDLAGVES